MKDNAEISPFVPMWGEGRGRLGFERGRGGGNVLSHRKRGLSTYRALVSNAACLELHSAASDGEESCGIALFTRSPVAANSERC